MNATETNQAIKLPVLVVTPQPFFEERGTPIAVKYVADVLSELGYQVDLVAFPIGKKVEVPGLRIHRVFNLLGIRSVPIGFSLRKLFLDIFLYFKVRKLLKEKKYSYVHAVEEAAFIVALVTRKSKVPFIYDMASSIPEQLADHKLLGLQPVLKFFKKLETWVVRKASFIICSGGLLPHVQAIKADANAKEWWFPSVVIEGVSSDTVDQFKKQLQVESGESLFVYTGSFSSYQGINVLLEAITLVEAALKVKGQRSARFLLAGATEEELKSFKEQWNSKLSSKVSVLGRVPRGEIGKMLLAADVLISPRLYGGNIPLKVFDYIGAGKPIIASDIPAHRAVLDESRAVFFENTPDGLANEIVNLLDDSEKAASLGKQSLAYAEEYLTWSQFRSYIQSMINQVQNNN